MTLVDIRNQVVDHLCRKDTFTKSDFEAIKLEAEHDDDKDGLIRESLMELCEMGMVRKVGDSDTWILTEPLNARGQEIGLSMETCNEVAKAINAYLDGNEMKGPRVDALNISEGAIIALLKIIDALLE